MASGLATSRPLTSPHTGKRWAFRARGLVGALVVAGFGVGMLFSPPHFAADTWGAVGCKLVGWVLFAAGALMRFWSTLYIGGRKLHTLACEGPYSIVRNPLYVGTFLIWSSAAVYFQSLTLGLGVLLGIAFYRLFAVPAEEKQLRANLGEPYDQYLRTVPRFVPNFGLWRSPETITVTVLGLWLECRRASRWIWLPVLAEVVNQLRVADGWPHVWLLP